MLTLYLIALAIGGTLVVASLLFGGDAEADADVDADIDCDAGLDVDVHAGGDVGHGLDFGDWLPVTSIRFWTFFLAFFGLTGTLMQGLGVIDMKWVTVAISSAVGWVCGTATVIAYRKLKRDVVNSHIGEADFVGATGTIVVAVAKGNAGKIRLQMGGRTVELIAETEDDEEFAAKQNAIVFKVKENGSVLIARP